MSIIEGEDVKVRNPRTPKWIALGVGLRGTENAVPNQRGRRDLKDAEMRLVRELDGNTD